MDKPSCKASDNLADNGQKKNSLLETFESMTRNNKNTNQMHRNRFKNTGNS